MSHKKDESMSVSEYPKVTMNPDSVSFPVKIKMWPETKIQESLSVAEAKDLHRRMGTILDRISKAEEKSPVSVPAVNYYGCECRQCRHGEEHENDCETDEKFECIADKCDECIHSSTCGYYKSTGKGTDTTTLGFMRHRKSSERLKDIGTLIEKTAENSNAIRVQSKRLDELHERVGRFSRIVERNSVSVVNAKEEIKRIDERLKEHENRLNSDDEHDRKCNNCGWWNPERSGCESAGCCFNIPAKESGGCISELWKPISTTVQDSDQTMIFKKIIEERKRQDEKWG